MKMTDMRYCVFILSHGRADNVKTLKTLKEGNYTGDWFIVVDDTDTQVDKYIENFGQDRIIIFNKQSIADTFDLADLSDDWRSVVFARNFCFSVAQERGFQYFLQLDDDYHGFYYKYEDTAGLHDAGKVVNLTQLFDAMFTFLHKSNISGLAFGQTGDLIGGANSHWVNRPLRKMMNAIFLRASDDWRFIGRVNEDVNTYATLGIRGHVFLTIMEILVDQANTQQQEGGYTELYLSEGTYHKSMFSVISCPSAVCISTVGTTRKRIHHKIKWNNLAPKILSESFKHQTEN